MARIVIDTPMETMSVEEQERIWIMSRTNDVLIRDVNDALWTVIDMTDDQTEVDLLVVRLGDKVKFTVERRD